MAAGLEYQVISKIIELQDFHSIQRLKITEEYFYSSECKSVFNYLWNCFNAAETFGSVPSFQICQQIFPGLQYSPSLDSLDILCEELRKAKMRLELLDIADKIHQYAEFNPREGMAALRAAAADLSTRHEVTNDLLLSSAYDVLLKDYNLVAEGHGLTGLPWPWMELNGATQGIHNGEFIVVYGRPKNMKCVVEGQKIMMKDGGLLPIEQVPESTTVPSYTEKTGRIRWAEARRVVSGTKECVEVTTKSGLRLRTSTEHLYMVPGGGYKRICDLTPGDYVATARSLPSWESSSTMTSKEAQLLGFLVGDGNYTRAEVQLTSADEEIVARAVVLSRDLYGCTVVQGSRPIEYRIVHRGGKGNPLLDRLRDLGMHGKKSPNKVVPSELFRASPEAIKAFLGGLLDTDGHVSSKWTAWSSASKKLLEGVKHLLTRFGIHSHLREVMTNSNTLAYQLYVYSKEENTKLYGCLREHLCLSRKLEALRRLSVLDIKEKRNLDGVPYSEQLLAKILYAKEGKKWPRWGTSKFDASKLFRRTGKISRRLLVLLADGLESKDLKKEATTEIVWEKIDSIEPIGQKPCYDICIEDGQDPNFVVEGLVVHNTWVCLYITTLMNMFANARVLIYSLEMAPKQILRRVAAIRAVVNYKSLLSGTMQPHDKERFFNNLKEMADDVAAQSSGHININAPRHADLLVTSGKGAGGISFLHSKIREFRPDIVLVDGMYLMQDDRQQKRTVDWKAIAHISQDLKRTATQFDIPVIATAQANRKADKNSKNADLSEIAYSDAIAQDTDFSIRVQKRFDKSTREPEIILAFPGSREVDMDELLIHGIPAINFGLKSTTVIHSDDTSKPDKPADSDAPRTMPASTPGQFRK